MKIKKSVGDGYLVPTPLVDALVISIRDLPNRLLVAGTDFLYNAAQENSAGNPVENPGLYVVRGDFSGIIPIKTVVFTPTVAPDIEVPETGESETGVSVSGAPATGTITLTFYDALPDDRFTLTIKDDVVDPAGNKLDGETNAVEPQESPKFPTGDGIPGGNFVARFTVDSRPEVGTWSSGSVYVDTNGNTIFDPDNVDFTNRDITYAFGYGSAVADGQAFSSDDFFAGNFSAPGAAAADGFDKLAAYGSVGSGISGKWRWLIDVDNDGVPDPAAGIDEPLRINGLPVAGNFDGNGIGDATNKTNGDEVAVFTGTEWYFDTDHTYTLNASSRLVSALRGYPIVGDFDGDGKDDLGTWADDTFSFDLSSVGSGGPIPSLPGLNGKIDATIHFGFIGPRERPVAADLDRDGIDDIGLWVPDRSGVAPHEGAEWYFLVSNDRFPDDEINDRVIGTVNTLSHAFEPVPFGKDFYVQYGNQYAIPILGNFDPPTAQTTHAESVVDHTNNQDADDVNGDTIVSSIDVLILINRLNEQSSSNDPVVKSGKLQGIAVTANYLDTNRDKFLSAADALKVINRLNLAQSEGEGEAAQDSASVVQFSAVVGQEQPNLSLALNVQSLVIDVASLTQGVSAHDLAFSQLSIGVTTENDAAIAIDASEVHDELFSQLADEETAELVNDLEVLTENQTQGNVDLALEDVLNELFG